jgi:hypothetical protein
MRGFLLWPVAVGLALSASLIPPPAATGQDRELLERHLPLLRYDADEGYFAQPVDREGDVREGATVYGHVAEQDGSRWLQYWLFYAYNPQDRGVLHTGRHEGDWEFAQVRIDDGGRPVTATLAQHSWAERCAWDEMETSDDRQAPVLYVANGSHATYAKEGTTDRPWPDPNDEADGRGPEARPALTVIDDGAPAWVASDERWGGSRAGWVPGEQSSPLGPRFQEDGRWSRPASFEASARPCGTGAPGRPWQTWTLVAVLLAGAAGALVFRGRRRRST